jgi:hypothetical protein
MPRYFRLLIATLLVLAFEVAASDAAAAITISVDSPSESAGVPVVGTSMTVSVSVSSTYAVQSVSAQAGSISGALSPPSGTQGWTTTFATAGLPYGAQTLTVTATDIFNNTGSASVPFFHDNPPVIQLVTPLEAIARPTLDIAATCSTDDPGGCTGFQASHFGTVLASGQGSIQQTVDFSAYLGQVVVVTFSASDSNGQSSSVSTEVFVDTSARLVPVDSVNGYILDFDATRILYCGATNAVIRDRQTQAETVIGPCSFVVPYQSVTGPPTGQFTSVGAVWFGSTPAAGTCPMEVGFGYFWTGPGQQPSSLGSGCEDATVGIYAIAGDYATRNGDGIGVELIDLATGQSSVHDFPVLTSDAGGIRSSLQLPAIPTTSGDIWGIVPGVDLVSLGIYRDHQGVVTQLATTPGMPGYQLLPVTDGNDLVFNVYGSDGNADYRIALYANGAVQHLGQPGGFWFTPPKAYQVNNGWVAYTAAVNGVGQVFTQSPSGVATMQSVYNSDSVVDALAPTGEVMFINGGNRYRRQGSALPEQITSSTLGVAVPGCDGWYVKMGGTLFQVSETQDAGTGCSFPDGGASADAAIDGSSAVDSGAADGARAVDSGGAADATTQGDAGADAGNPPESVGSGDRSGGSAGRGGGCSIGHPARGLASGWGAGFLVAWALGFRRARRRARP